MKKLAIGGEPKPPNGVAAPTIVVSDAPEPSPSSMKGAGSDRADDRRKAEKKKEKIERERLEKLERKEQKRLEKLEKEVHKKSPKGGSEIGREGKDGGGGKVVDRFLGSKVAMEKFFKKKVKDREERKEKEKEERERERILAEELSASGDEGGEAVKDKMKMKKKKKENKMNSKISSKGYSSEGTSSNDENGGGDGRKKKRKTFSTGSGSASSSSTSSSPSSSYTSPSPSPSTTPDKEKDPMERESEREDEKEKTTDSDDSSSSDDDSESEEETGGQRGLLHPNSGSNVALRQQRRRKKDWTVSQEFRVLALETEEKQKPDFSFALQHKNRDKNRYGNALPNPETRVVLKGGDTDYINANYIQGEQTQYIAAQAPLPNTFSDFWLMVWEQNTRVIMMLTRLTENDRTKAEIYWPRKGPLGRARGSFSGEDGGWKQYGKMRVSLVKSTIQEGDEDVTIRHFRLRNDEEPDVERQVIQIHFTGWPDFGVPQNTKAFTQLLELMESFNKEPTITGSTEPNGPIVLHCSAGLGRTGTLIAAHIAAEKLKLKTVKSKEDIDMKAIVAILREQRSGMVQTKCQYKFLHDLLNDL